MFEGTTESSALKGVTYSTEKLYALNGMVGRILRFSKGGEWCEFQYRDLHRCVTQVPTCKLKECKGNT